MSITNGQKAVLHKAKQELAMSREEYEAALQAYAGVTSAADPEMDNEKFRAVMAHLKRCGFKWQVRTGSDDMPAAFFAPKEFEGRQGVGWASSRQIWLIHRLWWGLKGSYWGADINADRLAGLGKRALERFVAERFGVDALRFLQFKEAGKVINALKAIQKRMTNSEQSNIE